jgi:hypothetical protein
MHLRPVGNDFCDRDRMRHVEADAEAVAGIVFGRRQSGDQRQQKSGGNRIPPRTAKAK